MEQFDAEMYGMWHEKAVEQYQKIVWELRCERKRQKITQAQMAARLDLPQSRISEFETLKETQKSLLFVLMYVTALGMTLNLVGKPKVRTIDQEWCGEFESAMKKLVMCPSDENAKDVLVNDFGFVPKEADEILAGTYGD